MQVSVPAAGDAAMAAAAVEKRLQGALRERGKLRIVAGRPLRAGDVAIIDFVAARTDREPAGEPVAGSQTRGMQLDTASAEDTINIPGAPHARHSFNLGIRVCIVKVCRLVACCSCAVRPWCVASDVLKTNIH